MLGVMLGEAWHAMGANRLRTFLTMLGMVIGVGAVILMMAIGQGVQYSVNQSIASMGSNLFLVVSGSTTSGGVRMGGGMAPTLTLNDSQAITELPGIAAAAPVASGTAQVVYGPNNWSTGISGVTPDYLEVANWQIAEGAWMSESDVRSATRVAVLGLTVAQNLFGEEEAVGKTIRIKQSPFVVIGVLAPKGQSLDGRDQDDTILVPVRTAQRQLFGQQFQNTVRHIMVQATSASVMPAAEREMNDLLRQRHRIREGGTDDFTVRNMTAMAETAAQTAKLMSLLLGAIASISLVVGGVGIMNIMLVSVTERTREIGIRLAIGALENQVLTQFLVEAVALSLFGGIAGIMLGLTLAYGTVNFLNVPFVVSPLIIFIAFIFSAAIGMIFGFFPARRAAQLNPIEALRHE